MFVTCDRCYYRRHVASYILVRSSATLFLTSFVNGMYNVVERTIHFIFHQTIYIYIFCFSFTRRNGVCSSFYIV